MTELDQLTKQIRQATDYQTNKQILREKIQADGAEPAGGSSVEFRDTIGREIQIWGKVVRDIGIQPQ